jgi:hypothetical protein
MATLVGQKKGKKIDVSTDGQRLVYKATREYLVYDSSGTEGEGTVLTTAGLPSVNLAYSFDGLSLPLICKNKSAQQWEDNNRYWTVTAEYDNQPQQTQADTGGQEGDASDPTTWYAIANISFETYEEARPQEKNLAGRPYENPLVVTRLIPVLRFRHYISSSKTLYELIDEYNDVVNEDDFLKSGILRSWLLTIANAQFGVTNGVECWAVDFELRYRVIRIENEVWLEDSDGNLSDVTDAGKVYGGWDSYIPQYDLTDKDDNPFLDNKSNVGVAGKLDVTGSFLGDQTQPFLVKIHPYRKERDFSFIKLRQ